MRVAVRLPFGGETRRGLRDWRDRGWLGASASAASVAWPAEEIADLVEEEEAVTFK